MTLHHLETLAIHLHLHQRVTIHPRLEHLIIHLRLLRVTTLRRLGPLTIHPRLLHRLSTHPLIRP